MNKVSLLENFKPSYGRACGNTTRLIDNAVQLLFDGNVVIVRDSWENGTHEQANLYLFEGIIRRMSIEHRHIKLIVNKRELILQIKKKGV